MADAILTPAKAPRRGLFARLMVLSPVAIYLWLALLVIAPNLLLLVTSFMQSRDGVVVFEPTLANYTKVLSSGTVGVLMLRTLVTAFASALLAALIAYPLAFFVSRHMQRGKMVAVIMVVVPLWVSLLMRAFAWRVILGEQGVLNSFLVSSGILDHPSDAFLYTRFAVVLTLAYMAIPYVFISSYTALERVPNSLLEASLDCGGGPWRSFVNVVWPLTKQGLAIGLMLAFLLAVGDYVTPAMVGGLDGTMLGMVIASQFGMANNWPLGAAQATVLILAVAAILLVIALLARTRGVVQAVDAGAGFAPRAPRTLRERLIWIAVRVLVVLPYILLYAPLVITMMFSFNAGRIQTFPLTGFTLQWYADLLGNANLIKALVRTLIVASTAVGLSAVVGIGFAMILTYRTVFASNTVQLLLAVPVAIPGIVLGISLVIAFQLFGLPQGLPRVILGHATFVMPVMLMIVFNRLKRLDPSFMQASLDLGASYWQSFRYVLLPIISSAVVGGALLGFTLSVDEVIVTLFLTGAEPTLPVYVWNQLRFGFTPSINAIFTLIGTGSLVLILLGMWVMNRGNDKSSGPAWL